MPELARQQESTTDHVEPARQAAVGASYQDLLGQALGTALYGLVHKELSPDALLRLGNMGLDGMVKAGAGALKQQPGLHGALDEQSEAEAAQRMATALGSW